MRRRPNPARSKYPTCAPIRTRARPRRGRYARGRPDFRVEPAGEVGAGDDVEHGGVVTEFPHPEPFGEVGIEIDGGHWSSLGRRRIQPAGPIGRQAR